MHSKLEIRMLNYFLLIAFAAILIGIEFYFELESSNSQEICRQLELANSQINPLDTLRTKILIMFLVLSVVVAIVLMMFIKNITHPLSKMVMAAKCINEGDLSQTIETDSHDEIGEVGMAINELASNLQEVASFTSMTSNQALEKISALRKEQFSGNQLLLALNDIQANLEAISSFANSFKLLNTEVKNG